MTSEQKASPSTRKTLGLVLLFLSLGVLTGVLAVRALSAEMSVLLDSWGSPFWLSVRVALMATCISGLAGVAAGYLLAKGGFPGRDLLEALGSVPLILPPTVLGYYLLSALNKGTTLGRGLEAALGGPVVFHTRGIVIVAAIAGFPFALRASRAAIAGVDQRFEQAGRAMGLPEWRVALQITLPAARRGIAVGLTLAMARAMGEFGATLMVGGNIAGQTRTMSVGLESARSIEQTNALIILMVVISLTAMIGLVWLERPQVSR